MLIVCDSCGAEYEVELGDDEEFGDEAMRFRCSACGHTFTVGEDGTSSALSSIPDDWHADPVAGPEPAEAEPPMLLKQEGKVYQVDDAATLQRWIVERRVLREDLLSIGGLKWEPVGSRRDLQVFFQLVESVEEADGSEGMAAPPVDGIDRSGAVQGAAPWEMGAAGAGVPSPAESSMLDAFAAPEADDDEWEDDDGTDAGLPVFGAPPVAAVGPDPTDLPEGPSIGEPDGLRNLAMGGSATAGERVELPPLAGGPSEGGAFEGGPSEGGAFEGDAFEGDAVEDDAADGAEASYASYASHASHASHASAPSVGDPTSVVSAAGEPVVDGPSGGFREEQATEEIARPLPDDLTDDMLFPEERQSEGISPVRESAAVQSARPVGWPPPEPEPTPTGEGGIPTWVVVVGAVAALVALVWFLNRGEGTEIDAGGGDVPVADAGEALDAASAEAAPTGAAPTDVAPAETRSPTPAHDPKEHGALMPAPGTALDQLGADPPAAQAPAGEAGGPDGDAAAAEKAAAEKAAAEKAAAEKAAAEKAAVERAAAEQAAAEKAAREAAARQAAAREPAASEPAAPRTVSVKRMVDQGWAAVERGDLAGARTIFTDALKREPGNADARFGLGYAYEKLGNEPAAVRNYCQVAASGAGDARIEAQGRLRALEASCE